MNYKTFPLTGSPGALGAEIAGVDLAGRSPTG